MHGRRRNSGNGVRSNAGMGGRNSPEGSVRTHGMYNMEYRNFNRGFGRGPPKPYPPPHTPRKTDIFMEAGRLAAEYLVFQGFLSPDALPGKWQNGSLKTNGDFQEFKQLDREQLQLASEGRMSALARLGDVGPDMGYAKRRFPDEITSSGSKTYSRGRKRSGSFKGYSSDWGKESGSSGSRSEKARSFSDMEGEDDFVSANYGGEQRQPQVGPHAGGSADIITNGNALKNDSAGESEFGLKNLELPNDTGSKEGSSSSRKELLETDGRISKCSDDAKVVNVDTREVKDALSDGKEEAAREISLEHRAVECDRMNEKVTDLLRLCSFVKVPTRVRSSLAFKASKVDPVPTVVRGNTCDIAPSEELKVTTEEIRVEDSSGVTLPDLTQTAKCSDSDTLGVTSVQALEDDVDLETAAEDGENFTMLHTYPDTSFMSEDDSATCSSLIDRGGKRPLQQDDCNEMTKKPREWLSSMVVDADEYFQNSGPKLSNLHEERILSEDGMAKAVDMDELVETALLKGGLESVTELREENPNFLNSFKICDLNLMGSSDMTDGHGSDPIIDLPSTLQVNKEQTVDVDLSKSNYNISNNYSRNSVDGREIIIVDSENESMDEDKAFDTPDRKNEAAYSSLESFPTDTQRTGNLPDVQDGYGSMISELLGNEISNCSSVPADSTSLPTEMNLHDEPGILCDDDDQIFLSLGEIPISFQGVWPEKPF